MLPKRIFISGASGSGKSTVINYLLEKYPSLFKLSVSYTTREKRANEIDHKEYHFITKKEFLMKIENKEMFEYQIFNKEYYGTSVKELNSCDKTILFDLGKLGVQAARKNNLSGIYISILCKKPVLINNLIHRAGGSNISDESILDTYGRLLEYENDKSFFKSNIFDYKIINQSKEQLIEDICKIFNL